LRWRRHVDRSAFTGFCPLALILKKLGAKPGAAFGWRAL